MITAALAFIHARRWLVELIMLAALVAGVTWFCHSLIQKGVAQQQAADAVIAAQAQHDADVKTAQLEERAHIAEKVRDQERTDNDQYRVEHPLAGRVRICSASGSNLPGSPQAKPGDAATTAAASLGDSVSSATTGKLYDRGALLDAFGALFDSSNGQVRQWQGSR